MFREDRTTHVIFFWNVRGFLFFIFCLINADQLVVDALRISGNQVLEHALVIAGAVADHLDLERVGRDGVEPARVSFAALADAVADHAPVHVQQAEVQLTLRDFEVDAELAAGSAAVDAVRYRGLAGAHEGTLGEDCEVEDVEIHSYPTWP